jgi:hypothetical protein
LPGQADACLGKQTLAWASRRLPGQADACLGKQTLAWASKKHGSSKGSRRCFLISRFLTSLIVVFVSLWVARYACCVEGHRELFISLSLDV